jgi:hypothetical protein
MKAIIVGASGFIGGAVLRRCLQLPAITAAVVLARRPLEGVSDPKLTTIVHPDFAVYPAELLNAHADAGACIWYDLILGKRWSTLMHEQVHGHPAHADGRYQRRRAARDRVRLPARRRPRVRGRRWRPLIPLRVHERASCRARREQAPLACRQLAPPQGISSIHLPPRSAPIQSRAKSRHPSSPSPPRCRT